MTPDRERLKTAIEGRAVELRLKLSQVAARAEMSAANFLRIRNGEVALTPLAIAAIEHALEWERGSVQAVLDGDPPTPRGDTRAEPHPPRGTAEELADQIAELQRLQARTEQVLNRVEELTQGGAERRPKSA